MNKYPKYYIEICPSFSSLIKAYSDHFDYKYRFGHHSEWMTVNFPYDPNGKYITFRVTEVIELTKEEFFLEVI